MNVEKVESWIPVSDEDIVDFGIGTPEQQATAQARIDRDRAKMDRYWRRLPWYVRLYRTLRSWQWSVSDRLRRSRKDAA